MLAVQAPLLNEELTSLHVLSAASRENAAAAISAEHRDTLLRCGYAADRSGTLAITPCGQAKLVYETTRAIWFPSA